jgi:putative transcriptional regulator|tara:strand:- start:366 stop:938 length:573 start_codon:yes stop_codon:yes gene_type:complete
VNLTGRYQTKTCLSGSILLSHPSLKDPNFSKTIVFLSAHSDEVGTVGVILNRPLGQTLDQLDNQFKIGTFGKVPVFEGGPVERDKLIVAAWEWLESPSSFKLYFGIDLEKAESLRSDNQNINIACFLGHSGWSPGQLEDELEQDSWIVSTLNHDLFAEMDKNSGVWHRLVGNMGDELKLLADAPDDPQVN